MKKRVISILLVGILLTSGMMPVMAEENIKDVSKNHWAYKSVVELVDKGYLSLYEGNKFKGEKPVTRYQLAEVIAKVLNNVNQGQLALDKEEVLTLKKLATEFRSELVEVMSKSDKLTKKTENISEQQQILEEDLVNTNDKLSNLRRELNGLISDMKEEAVKINKLRERISALEEEKKTLEDRVDELETKVDDKTVSEDIENLERKFYWVTAGGSVLLLLLAASK